MSSAPYRTSPNASLGASTHTYRRSNAATARTAVIAVGLLIIALPLVAGALDRLASGEPTGVFLEVKGLFVGLAATGLALALVVNAVRSRDLSLDLRELGFVRHVNGVETAVLWDDVREVAFRWKSVRRWARDGCTVRTKDGGQIELTDALAGIREIRAVIQKECVSRLLRLAVGDVEAGRRVTFGPFVARSEGLAHRGKELAWKDVKGVAVVRGIIAVGDRKDGVRVLPKRGGVVAWATEAYDSIPNAEVMLALFEKVKRG